LRLEGMTVCDDADWQADVTCGDKPLRKASSSEDAP
jgi:hypothetical protein